MTHVVVEAAALRAVAQVRTLASSAISYNFYLNSNNKQLP